MNKKKPISFWVRNILWDEDGLIRISKQLNFHMRYFDQQSPIILIHNPKSESGNIAGVRYPHERFPDVIVNRDIDDAMMSFWQASLSGDPARRFLYSYQILEYAAFYFLEENIRRSVRRAVAAPHALDRLDRITVEVIEAVSAGKLSDPQKIEAVMKTAVSPAQVWQEIHANIEFFCKPTVFEGGYEAPSLAKQTWSAGDFETNWMPTMCGALRGIRNALSHGREQRMSSVIMPTAHNLALLRNWLPPISVIAREIMLYRNVG